MQVDADTERIARIIRWEQMQEVLPASSRARHGDVNMRKVVDATWRRCVKAARAVIDDLHKR